MYEIILALHVFATLAMGGTSHGRPYLGFDVVLAGPCS
jgi:hypothetical protein